MDIKINGHRTRLTCHSSAAGEGRGGEREEEFLGGMMAATHARKGRQAGRQAVVRDANIESSLVSVFPV